jgi:hypothetical protein
MPWRLAGREMEVAMRTIATTLMAAGWLLIGANASEAQTYPWCAVYHDKFGAWNCGFVTFEQCLATVRGIGGMAARILCTRPNSRPSRAARSAGIADNGAATSLPLGCRPR